MDAGARTTPAFAAGMKSLFLSLTLSLVALVSACGGVEGDEATETTETHEAALMNTGRGSMGSCTIQTCAGASEPGEMACYFGVCVCVAGGKQVQCTSGSTMCVECPPPPPKPPRHPWD